MEKRFFLILLSLIYTLNVFPQTIEGEWKTIKSINDIITLQRGGFNRDDTREYLNRHYNYIDTTYYWHFYKEDSLRIIYVVRSNKVEKSE
ncbi:MAG: hypothetical protein AAFU64_05035, partial [Bacteroidota bacterium]